MCCTIDKIIPICTDSIDWLIKKCVYVHPASAVICVCSGSAGWRVLICTVGSIYIHVLVSVLVTSREGHPQNAPTMFCALSSHDINGSVVGGVARGCCCFTTAAMIVIFVAVASSIGSGAQLDGKM
jgi:hypothetical protein